LIDHRLMLNRWSFSEKRQNTYAARHEVALLCGIPMFNEEFL
jgi:hypothetical protein